MDIQNINEMIKACEKATAIVKELDAYRQIGTLDECRTAREKMIPKEPITYKRTNRADCPICGKTVRGISKPFGNYCSNCGQALKWGD